MPNELRIVGAYAAKHPEPLRRSGYPNRNRLLHARWTGLTIAVYPAITLFVAGWIPGKVIMQDGIKMFLQVDTFTQAVRCNQNMFFGLHTAVELSPRVIQGAITR